MFSLSLICGNLAYLYLSVSFIQMLKATNAVVTLLATWAFGISQANLRTLGNVFLIVVGVAIASFGEIKFDMFGFLSMSFITVLILPRCAPNKQPQSRSVVSSSRPCAWSWSSVSSVPPNSRWTPWFPSTTLLRLVRLPTASSCSSLKSLA